MRLTRTIGAVADEDGRIYHIDTIIDNLGQAWLVPEWIESPFQGLRRPRRVILMNNLRYQRANRPDFEFVLNDPILRPILNGEPNLPKAYTVIENPDMPFPTAKGVH